jgi:hypothetical protein
MAILMVKAKLGSEQESVKAEDFRALLDRAVSGRL